MASINIRIAGANGDGIESSGSMLMKVAARLGLQVFGYRGYQSLIRGGHVWYQIRIGDERLYSHGNGIDILVALNQEGIINQASHLNGNAVVIYDSGKVKVDSLAGGFRLVPMPLLDLAIQTSGDPIMKNVVAIGAVLKMLGIDIRAFDEVVRAMFGRKGEEIVNSNVKAAGIGYGYAGVTTMCSFKMDGKARRTIDGNTALALGAYAGGCKLYAAYPMTPASTILHWFASHENKGVLMKQTEDEITAINTAIGAATAGVRAMCGTSGGGFSLMVEALGFAGMVETPLVVVDSQRTGPSTGLPAKTEQADMLFAMHASQGEFPRIVVAPRSVEECFHAAIDAFNLADRYQCPVIILLDQFLSEHTETVEDFDLNSIEIDRGKLLTSAAGASIQGGKFKRYLYTDDGVSPRAVFGTPGLEHIAPTDEHDEFGNLMSDALSGIDEYVAVRKKMNEKRMSKIDTMLKTETVFRPSTDRQDADYYFVTWGSSTLAVTEAAMALNSQGFKFGIISFNYLMPLDKGATKSMLSGKRLIDVECNFTGQLAQLIMLNTGIEVKDRILRYDGEALTSKEVVSRALEIVKQK